ncbi:hypothetical protein [Microscilla marina]|nr:hypothetical protein [Microscilla marina]
MKTIHPLIHLSKWFSFILFSTTLFTTTYAQCPKGSVESNNLVVNGNFSQGNRYFHSGYRVSNDLYPEGTYQVGTNPTKYHGHFKGRSRRGARDKFLIVNGSPRPNVSVWCQQIKIRPKTYYNFSAWITTLVARSPARLHFSVNGHVLGTNINAPDWEYNWKKFEVTWFSGNETTANICIVNLSTLKGGNDFGLDNIRFTSCVPIVTKAKAVTSEEAAAQVREY